MDAAQEPAKTAAAVAFIRAQERSSCGVNHRVISQDGQSFSQQDSLAGIARNVLKRRQSVRFVNHNAEKQRATSSASIQILAEPRPGFATVRPATTAPCTPAIYRPISPLSSCGKASTASEAPESVSGFPAHKEYSVHEDDILSEQSVRYGVRKSKSMFMPFNPPDILYTNGTRETPPVPCYNYGNGISSVPVPRTQSRQIHLKTHKSMNFLGLVRSQSGGRLSNDLCVQIARDKFLHQTNQQRLRERPSFLFRAKARRQEVSSNSSSDSNDNLNTTHLPDGISFWKGSRLGGKAHRAAKKIKSRLRRVFGRSMKAPVDIPHQQVDAPETHVPEYSGTDVQESPSDTDSSPSPSRSDIHASLSSYKNMTVRLVPPTPKRMPIYQLSQSYETPQDVSYSESVYSRNASSTTLEPESSSLTLPLRDDSRAPTGSAVILDTITYHPSTPKDNKSCFGSCSDVLAPWMTGMGSEDAKLGTDESELASNTAYINNISIRAGPVAYGHVRESAQINDDDTAVAQEPITIKQPLGELQHNARLNPEFVSVLKSTVKTASVTPLGENIGFSRSKPPPPPPLPIRLVTKSTPSRSATPPSIPPSEALRPDEKTFLPGSLANMVISSRNQDVSPRSGEPTATVPTDSASPSYSLPDPYPSGHAHPKFKVAKTPSQAHERLWKVEPAAPAWCANDTLRTMLVERGNIKRRISVTGTSSTPDAVTAKQAEKPWNTTEVKFMNNGGENADPQARDRDEDIYGVEGAGLMGPTMACRNIQLVGSLLSSRRSRITGCSESESEDDAFI